MSPTAKAQSELHREFNLPLNARFNIDIKAAFDSIDRRALWKAHAMRLYNALVKSVGLYGAETWMVLKYDEQKLEAFHMSCQLHILGIRWYDFVT